MKRSTHIHVKNLCISGMKDNGASLFCIQATLNIKLISFEMYSKCRTALLHQCSSSIKRKRKRDGELFKSPTLEKWYVMYGILTYLRVETLEKSSVNRSQVEKSRETLFHRRLKTAKTAFAWKNSRFDTEFIDFRFLL